MKSRLGFGLLAAVTRLRCYAADGSGEYRAFWQEIERARAIYRPNRTMNFFVEPAEGHDDFLMSLALTVEAARDSEPRIARGRRGILQSGDAGTRPETVASLGELVGEPAGVLV